MMFSIILICSILFFGFCQPTFAEDDYTIPVGQDYVFTQCNYYDTWLVKDYTGYPGPWSGEMNPQLLGNNGASLSLMTNPGYAGRAFVEIGVKFQWDLHGLDWNKIKNWPIKVSVELSYTIKAEEAFSIGSSNAGLWVTGILDAGPIGFGAPVVGVNCIDWIGHATGDSGTRTKSYENKFTNNYMGQQLTLDNLGNRISILLHCQTWSNPPSEEFPGSKIYASGQVNITKIKIEFIHLSVLLIHGLNPLNTPVSTYWNKMISTLDDAGIEHHEFDYGFGYESPEIAASKLQKWIQDIKDTNDYSGQFDIICHSYGAMVSRWYMEQLGGAKDIRQWIGIAPVNHGAAITDSPDCDFPLKLSRIFDVIVELNPALRAMKTKSNQLSKLNYNLDKFDVNKWKSDTENRSRGVIYHVLVGLDFMTDCVNKDARGHLYHYRTDRGDKFVPLFQSQLQNVGTDCYPGVDHLSLPNNTEVVQRAYDYLMNPYLSPRDDYPKNKDPYDHPPSFLGAILHILLMPLH